MNRRQFIKKAVSATIGLSSFSIFRPSRVSAATPELTVLTLNHFVPASDEKLKEQANAFAKERGVIVRVDTIPHLQFPRKLAAEIHAQSGHDIIWLLGESAWLYHEHLADVDAVIAHLRGGEGEWYPFIKESLSVNGSWKAVPWCWISRPGLYREDLFKEADLSAPDSWEDILNTGRILKPKGHPVGIAISQCNDAYNAFWSILWGFGGKVLESDGKTIALNSAETRTVLAYYESLYREAMEPEVLSWDDASNNRFLLSGKGSWIQNPISAYITAVEKKMDIADKIDIYSTPTGPAGRHAAVGIYSLGVWKFSKNQELALAFLTHLMQPENYNAWVEAGSGFNHGPLRKYENHPIWTQNRKFKLLPGEAQFGHALGWPSPPNAYIQRINDLFILPNMVAKAVTGTPHDQAILWAEEQIRQILKG
jgi:multiple sugar transport system substrate-binding protein